MSSYISEKLRKEVYERAIGYCEYCRLHERYAGAKHEIDHIIAEKHNGLTVTSNLCLCCLVCNRNKGSDIASVDALSMHNYPQNIVALYHPRLQQWSHHFQIINGLIEPLRLFQIKKPPRYGKLKALYSSEEDSWS
jgi:hypothetical protein